MMILNRDREYTLLLRFDDDGDDDERNLNQRRHIRAAQQLA